MQKPKIGGNETLRLFVKGNNDLAQAILAPETGFASLVKMNYEGKFRVETTHELSGGLDALLQQLDGTVPSDLLPDTDDTQLPVPLHSGFVEANSDLIAISIQPDVLLDRWQHKAEGFVIYPPLDWESTWSERHQQWLRTEFKPLGKLPAAEFKEKLVRLVQYMKERLQVHIVMFGCSSVDPDDETHNFYGRDDTISLRVHRFNLAMMEVSLQEGISFVDVDRLIAEMGAQEHVVGLLTYSPAAYAAIGAEFLRVVTDIGFFEKRPLLVQMGRQG